ncbi:hypothetical protein [Natronorubrum texcoconense]|uniref:DUF4382 domain-containing protein n=1 Tax=Natronorubrum texcoconense TaxID=1095776 RepID=A0A1G9BSA5_9EURY|nr:hypothetical protein [Natronorubrum texcoconense]SDK42378.1 hypothetical protein SAMN04515672_3070 [Natronorubrum texcoconense]
MTGATDSTCGIDRRTYLQAASGFAVASAIGLAGCLGDETDDSDDGNGDDEPVGTLTTEFAAGADAFDDFNDFTATIQGLWVVPAPGDEADETDDEETDDETEAGENDDSETNGESESDETDDGETDDESESEDDENDEQSETDTNADRAYYEFDDAVDVDLVTLEDGSQVIDERDLPVDEYELLQLDVSEIDATLTNDDPATVTTPDDGPLQFDERFEIRDGGETTFVAAVQPVEQDDAGTYVLEAVADGTEVITDGESSDDDTNENGDDDTNESGDDGDDGDNGNNDTGGDGDGSGNDGDDSDDDE